MRVAREDTALAGRLFVDSVIPTLRQHAGAALVAAALVTAAFAEGLFNPTGYATASILVWGAVIAGLVARALPTGPVSRTAAIAGLCLAATAVLAMASVGWASDQGRAFEEAVRVSFYLGLYVLVTVVDAALSWHFVHAGRVTELNPAMRWLMAAGPWWFFVIKQTAALVSFARESGSVVVAEGIETFEQMDALRDLGVDYGQGFLLGRPTAPASQ
jgi:hypothetical protein